MQKLMLPFCCRRPYYFTPLHPGSPGFLLHAVCRASVLPRPQAFLEDNFTLKVEASPGPCFARFDNSSYRKDDRDQLSMTMNFYYENKMPQMPVHR